MKSRFEDAFLKMFAPLLSLVISRDSLRYSGMISEIFGGVITFSGVRYCLLLLRITDN